MNTSVIHSNKAHLWLYFSLLHPDGKASAHNSGYPGLIPGLGGSPGEGNGNPLHGKSYGQRTRVVYSTLGRKELDWTEWLHFLSVHPVPNPPSQSCQLWDRTLTLDIYKASLLHKHVLFDYYIVFNFKDQLLVLKIGRLYITIQISTFRFLKFKLWQFSFWVCCSDCRPNGCQPVIFLCPLTPCEVCFTCWYCLSGLWIYRFYHSICLLCLNTDNQHWLIFQSSSLSKSILWLLTLFKNSITAWKIKKGIISSLSPWESHNAVGATEKYMNILGNENSSNKNSEIGTSASVFIEQLNILLLPEAQFLWSWALGS